MDGIESPKRHIINMDIYPWQAIQLFTNDTKNVLDFGSNVSVTYFDTRDTTEFTKNQESISIQLPNPLSANIALQNVNTKSTISNSIQNSSDFNKNGPKNPKNS